MNAKFISNVTTFTSTSVVTSNITDSSFTANTILSANGTKRITSLSTATYPSLTELAYVK